MNSSFPVTRSGTFNNTWFTVSCVRVEEFAKAGMCCDTVAKVMLQRTVLENSTCHSHTDRRGPPSWRLLTFSQQLLWKIWVRVFTCVLAQIRGNLIDCQIAANTQTNNLPFPYKKNKTKPRLWFLIAVLPWRSVVHCSSPFNVFLFSLRC